MSGYMHSQNPLILWLSVPLFETPVVEAAGSVLTSSDGLWKYELKEESGETVAVVDEYNGTDRDLVIPEEIDGYVVKYIGKPSGWSTVRYNRFDSITIPDSVAGLSNVPFFTHSHRSMRLSKYCRLFMA